MGCGGGAAERPRRGSKSAMRYVVSLPVYETPEAPDTCLLCGRIGATKVWPRDVPTLSVGWARGVRPLTFSPLLCTECGRSSWRQFWIELWIMVAAVGVVVAVFFGFGNLLPEGSAPAVCAMGVLVILLGWAFRVAFGPTPVRCCATPTQVRYSFRNRAYASDFARMNHAKVEP
jgi:hypothetical protein